MVLLSVSCRQFGVASFVLLVVLILFSSDVGFLALRGSVFCKFAILGIFWVVLFGEFGVCV